MKRLVPIFVVLMCQLLLSCRSFGYVAADDIECATPVNPVLARISRYNQPTIAEERRREIIGRLKSYFRWPTPRFGVQNIPVYTAEGVGEVYVSGDDIPADGVTEIDGAVPITGSVAFGGPVRASGTVTIAGRCAPASGFSPRPFPPSFLPPPLPALPPTPPALPPTPPALPPTPPALPPTPIIETPVEVPVPEPPTYTPTVVLPPVIIPAIVIPAYVIPEVVIPAEVFELGSGSGEITVTGDDIVVTGSTTIEGVVPAVGEVTFEGFVPAKGTVTICGHF